MKAIVLARVSTKEQADEGQSIPAQQRRMQEYALQKELQISKTFQIIESSTTDVRKEFEKIIEYIRSSKEPVALIVEAVDRLQRSFKESIVLDDFRKQGKLEIHFVRENLVLTEKANSSQLLQWDMAVMFARGYVLQLSDNVKRSVEQKIKNGEWAGMSPLGYLNVDTSSGKDIIPDPSRSHFVVKVYELYATGTWSMKKIKDEMIKLGFRTRKGKKPSESIIHHILRNPFYYGMMDNKGELHPHRYHRLISKDLYDKCQDVMAGYKKQPFKAGAKPFALRGMVKCAECGCLMSPYTKKGKYTYYACTNAKGFCTNKKLIKEEELLKPIYKALNAIQLPDEKIEELTQALKTTAHNETEFYTQSIDTLKERHDLLQNRISQLYDDKADGRITADFYDTKFKEYKEEQKEVVNEMATHVRADEDFYITANQVANLAQRAVEIFESSEPQEKRQLLGFLLQNCTHDGKNLLYELRSPFNELVLLSTNSTWLPRLDSNQRPIA